MNADIYREAAQEHIVTARVLLDAEKYVGAFYFAGLAVECIFRAYRFRTDPVFDARHDLYELWKASGYAERVPYSKQQEMSEALTAVIARWSNNHRYRSEEALRSWARRAGLFRMRGSRTIRGDVLAYNGRILVENAAYLVEWGVSAWDR